MASTITNRNYISLADAKSEVSTATLARLNKAEEAIDNYVGYQRKSVLNVFRGTVSSYDASTKTVVDSHGNTMLHVRNGYFMGCVIEVVGGTGAGQVRYISANSYNDYSLTVTDAFDTALDTTSVFKVYQLGKFPRQEDVVVSTDGLNYYKSVPYAVKRAVLAQLDYIQFQGDKWFQGDESNINGESLGNFSYTTGNKDQISSVTMLAPAARNLLKGIKNSTGELLAENPTEIDQIDKGFVNAE